jgi:predicted pyridoxine 5'-phosphate oxidase superfamily flavin-nucleotide-binding protein
MGILTDDMKRVVVEQRLGFIATVCADGTPNLSPKGTTKVWDDDHLVFADICSPGTIENLRSNASIEINVVDPMVRKGYRFKGTASVLESGETFEDVMTSLYDLSVENARTRISHVVLVRVERALPVISPAYDGGATEAEVRSSWEQYWRELHDAASQS